MRTAPWGRGLLLAALTLGGLASGCGGKPAPDGGTTPASTLSLTCGTYNAGLTLGLVVAAVIEPPRPTDMVLQLVGGVTATCGAGERVCIVALPGYTTKGTASDAIYGATGVQWDVGGGPRSALCSHGTKLPQPEGSARVVGGSLEVGWKPVPGAAIYAVTFRDLDLRRPEIRQPRTLGRIVTTGTSATFALPDGTPDLAVAEVEAWATDPASFTGGEVPAGGANRSVRAIPVIGAPWALKQPSDFEGGTLTVQVPEGKRVALVLLNLQGADGAVAALQATGTGPAAARRLAPAGPTSQVAAVPRPAWPTARAGGSSPSTPEASRTFCTFENPFYPLRLSDVNNVSAQPAVRRSATLLLETEHVRFYVDDADAGGFTAYGLDALAAWWSEVEASVTRRSGPPSDVDGSGGFTVLFTRALGPRAWSTANTYDIWSPLDDTSECKGMQSNQADMVHLHPPFGMQDDLGRPLPDEVQWAVVKGRMPYTLQRMVDSAHRGSDYPRDNEITHARMSLAETLAGSGNHLAELQSLAAPALFTRAGLGGGWGGYPALRMFPYELMQPHQEVIRAGIDSFVLYLADRLGPSFVQRFFDEVVDVRQLEVASGLPLPIAYALWTGALVFSNEPASPWQGFDYLGPDWTPLHEKFQRFEYASLEVGPPLAVTLRLNGFDVLVTGVAGPGGGAVTVTSAAVAPDQRPHVVAIPFEGALP